MRNTTLQFKVRCLWAGAYSSQLLALLTLIACGGGKISLPPEPNFDGSNFVFAAQSNPAGAEIWLDGQATKFRSTMLDSSPVPLPLPKDGKHRTLTLRLTGYHDWHQWVQWTGDASIIVKAKLTPKSEPNGTIFVTSEPSGAAVWLDGSDTGKHTPVMLNVSPSRHTLQLSLNGFLPAYESVDVPANGVAEVHVPMTPLDKGIITGIVFDRFGGGVFGAKVQLKNGQGQTVVTTRATAYGAFHFPSVPPGIYSLVAEATIEGVREVGRLDDVKVQPSQRTLAYLILFDSNFLGRVEGVVQTTDGKPVAKAQVAMLFYAVGLDFILTSRRTLTDEQGRFRFDEAPAAPQVLIARKAGFKSSEPTQVLVKQGETVEKKLTLTPLIAPKEIQAPTQVFAIAEILPTKAPNFERASDRGIGSNHYGLSFYRRVLLNFLRRHQHPVAIKLFQSSIPPPHSPSRFFPVGFLAQVEIGWRAPSTKPSQDLLGYRVYRSAPQASSWQGRLFVDEPEQVLVADAGFDFTAGQTYRYAVSAVGLDGRESPRSEPAETTMLFPIRLLAPDENEQVVQLNFRWQPINGHVPFYTVKLFGDPDSVLADYPPEWESGILAGVTEFGYNGKPLLKGKTYWWIVIGQDAPNPREANSFTVSEMRRVVIVGD